VIPGGTSKFVPPTKKFVGTSKRLVGSTLVPVANIFVPKIFVLTSTLVSRLVPTITRPGVVVKRGKSLTTPGSMTGRVEVTGTPTAGLTAAGATDDPPPAIVPTGVPVAPTASPLG
jgi:hypothetical protein